MKNKYVISYSMQFEGPTCFYGSGTGGAMVDRTFARDAIGRLVIPGTHVKGITRQKCEELSRSMGYEAEDPHSAKPAIPFNGPVESVFGRPDQGEISCVFTDLVSGESGKTGSVVNNRIRMDRKLGRPANKALFNTEYASVTGKTLHGSVIAWIANDPDNEPPLGLAILCGGLKLVDAVGGDKSIGVGAVRIDIKEVSSEGQVLPLKVVLAPLGKSNSTTKQGAQP